MRGENKDSSPELGPPDALAHLKGAEKNFFSRSFRGARELIVLLTTIFVAHGGLAEAGELKKFLPLLREGKYDNEIGPSPAQAAKRILALQEKTDSVLAASGGKAALIRHSLEINGADGQSVDGEIPSEKASVLAFGSRQLELNRGSLEESIENPSQSYWSTDALVEMGEKMSVVPSGEEMVVTGYGRNREEAIVNALTFAAQEYKHNILSGPGTKDNLLEGLGDMGDFDFAAIFDSYEVIGEEDEGNGFLLKLKLVPGTVKKTEEQ